MDTPFVPLPSGNRLVLYETGISLPEGWLFFFPEGEDTFLEFSDAKGLYYGCLEWCPSGLSMTGRDLSKYYMKNFMSGINVTRVFEDREIEGGPVILECEIEGDDSLFYVSIIPLHTGFFVMELYSSKSEEKSLRDLCIGIAATVTAEYPNVCRRSISGLYDFHSLSSIWKWTGDFTGGGVFHGFLPGRKLCTVTIAGTDLKSIEDVVPDSGEYTYFDGLVPVNNLDREVQAAGRRLPTGVEVYALIEGPWNFTVHIACVDDEHKLMFSELLPHPEIREFFLANISFTGFQ